MTYSPDRARELLAADAAAITALPELATELRAAQTEIERLNQCIRWEQNRASNIGTHSPNCHLWGHRHYECLERKYRELEAQYQQQQDEIESLQGDARRLDWLADPDNRIGNVQLPRACVEANLTSLRGAIDAAMKLKESDL